MPRVSTGKFAAVDARVSCTIEQLIWSQLNLLPVGSGLFRWLLPTIEATQRWANILACARASRATERVRRVPHSYKCPCQYWEDIHYTYYLFQIPEPYSAYR